MKKVLYLLALSIVMFSCENDKKETVVDPKGEPEQVAVVEDNKEDKVKLPDNVVQLNKDAFEGVGITLTRAQIENTKDDKFIYKIFLKINDIKAYQNGDYSLFIQNVPYEDDIHLLDDKAQKSGVVSYWVNLKSAKAYKDEFVIFKSFTSEIYTFEKVVVGVKNVKDKTDVFRTQFDDPIIVNE